MHRKTQLGIKQGNGSRAHAQWAPVGAAFFAEAEKGHGLPDGHNGRSAADGEATLVSQAQAGDADAFSTLVCGHLQTLYRLALRITRNREDAEDVVQDAILKAHANLSGFQQRARFSTWITRIAINEALMTLRRHKRMKRVPLEVPVPSEESDDRSWELPLDQEDPEALYARMQVREKLLQAARSLSPAHQAVFVLAYMRGCTNQETADRLGLSVATVKSRLHRARKQVCAKLDPACTERSERGCEVLPGLH